MKVLIGIVLGVLLLGGARFAFSGPPPATHHHANFAVYLNGERLDLSGDQYMEEVAACYAAEEGEIAPEHRAHMHENVGDVVHVHHPGVTWGHFFENLGFAVGPDYFFTGTERYFDGEEGTLRIVVNGFLVEDVSNRPIQSQDRLLISFGNESSDTMMGAEFESVPSTAAEFNLTQDPASCAGHGELTFGERLRWAFWGL